MRGGGLADAYSMYKRASTKDQFTDYEDREENLGTPYTVFFRMDLRFRSIVYQCSIF